MEVSLVLVTEAAHVLIQLTRVGARQVEHHSILLWLDLHLRGFRSLRWRTLLRWNTLLIDCLLFDPRRQVLHQYLGRLSFLAILPLILLIYLSESDGGNVGLELINLLSACRRLIWRGNLRARDENIIVVRVAEWHTVVIFTLQLLAREDGPLWDDPSLLHLLCTSIASTIRVRVVRLIVNVNSSHVGALNKVWGVQPVYSKRLVNLTRVCKQLWPLLPDDLLKWAHRFALNGGILKRQCWN